MQVDFLMRQMKETYDRMEVNEASTCNLVKISDWIMLQYINAKQGDELADYNSKLFRQYQY